MPKLIDAETTTDKLTHNASCKAVFKRLSSEQIKGVIEVGREVIELKKLEAEQEEKDAGVKFQAIERAKKILSEAGLKLNSSELLTVKGTQSKKPYRAMNPDLKTKYRIEDKHGLVCFWSGSGHPPKPFKEAMQKFGFKKEELLALAKVKITVPFSKQARDKCEVPDSAPA